MKQCKCYATVTNPDRQAMWKRIFPPNGQVPITCPIPAGVATLVGEKAEFYLVDFDRVPDAAKEMLITEIAKKFNLPATEVGQDIKEQGCPIKAIDVMTSWCQIHALAAMPDDEFEESDGEVHYPDDEPDNNED